MYGLTTVFCILYTVSTIICGVLHAKRTHISARLSLISSKLILWAGGHETLLNTKGHLLEVSHCGDIIGHLFDLFPAFDAVYLVYPSTVLNKFSCTCKLHHDVIMIDV